MLQDASVEDRTIATSDVAKTVTLTASARSHRPIPRYEATYRKEFSE